MFPTKGKILALLPSLGLEVEMREWWLSSPGMRRGGEDDGGIFQETEQNDPKRAFLLGHFVALNSRSPQVRVSPSNGTNILPQMLTNSEVLRRLVSWIIMWVDEVDGIRGKEGAAKDGPTCCAALIDLGRQRGRVFPWGPWPSLL